MRPPGAWDLRPGLRPLEAASRRAPVEQLEGGNELRLEETAPAPFVGEGRERLEQVEISGHTAIAGLVPEDRHHHLRLDPEALLQPGKLRAIGTEAGRSPRDEVGGDVAGAIGREGRDDVAVGWPYPSRPDFIQHFFTGLTETALDEMICTPAVLSIPPTGEIMIVIEVR